MVCRNTLHDERGSNVVEAVALIALLLGLLGAIGLAFYASGGQVGRAVVDQLIAALSGLRASWAGALPGGEGGGGAVMPAAAVMVGIFSFLLAATENSDVLVSTIIGLAAGLLAMGLATQNGRRALAVSWLTITRILPHYGFTLITRPGTGFGIVNRTARPTPRWLAGLLAWRTRKGRIFHLDYGPLAKGKKAWHLNVDTGWKWLRNLNHMELPSQVRYLANNAGLARYLSKVMKWAGPIAITIDVIDLGSSIYKDQKAGKGFGPETKRAVGRIGGGWTGAAGGALIGSMIWPGPGTLIGAVIGGIGGGLGGEWIANQFVDEPQAVQESASP